MILLRLVTVAPAPLLACPVTVQSVLHLKIHTHYGPDVGAAAAGGSGGGGRCRGVCDHRCLMLACAVRVLDEENWAFRWPL